MGSFIDSRNKALLPQKKALSGATSVPVQGTGNAVKSMLPVAHRPFILKAPYKPLQPVGNPLKIKST